MVFIKYIKETLKYFLRSKFFIRKYIKEIEDLYSMSPLELEQRNEKRFLEIFRAAYLRSPFYHQLYLDAGIQLDDIKSIKDIKKLPIISKDDIRKNGESMLTVSKYRLLKNHTSGTTGTPLTVFEDWESIWREQAYFYCYRKRCGYIYGQPLVSLRGNLEKKNVFLKVHISNTLYLSSYNINDENIHIYYEQILMHKPFAIEGYPSSLYLFALLLKKNAMQLHIPLTFTSSETLLDYQRELIVTQLDTCVYDHYGTTERTIRLSEKTDHSGYFEDPGYSINEYLENGELTTSLINMSFPLIRYKGDDKIKLSDNGKNIIGIVGRIRDNIVCKDGCQLQALDFIVKEVSNIKASQLVQYEIGKVVVKLVPDEGFDDYDKEKVISSLQKRVGKDNLEIICEVTTMDGLIYSNSGKFKHILNLI